MPTPRRLASRLLAGPVGHPGGAAQSRRLVRSMALTPGALVCDVGCGRGRTVAALRRAGVRAVGVDIEAGGAVRADAHALPLRSGTYDGVLAECLVSTLADPGRAVAEMARLLRPGGRLGLTDVVVAPDAEPATAAVVAALTHPRPVGAVVADVERAGLRVHYLEDRRTDALEMARRVRRRAGWAARVVAPLRPVAAGAAAVEAAVRDGQLSYLLLVAVR